MLKSIEQTRLQANTRMITGFTTQRASSPDRDTAERRQRCRHGGVTRASVAHRAAVSILLEPFGWTLLVAGGRLERLGREVALLDGRHAVRDAHDDGLDGVGLSRCFGLLFLAEAEAAERAAHGFAQSGLASNISRMIRSAGKSRLFQTSLSSTSEPPDIGLTPALAASPSSTVTTNRSAS